MLCYHREISGFVRKDLLLLYGSSEEEIKVQLKKTKNEKQ